MEEASEEDAGRQNVKEEEVEVQNMLDMTAVEGEEEEDVESFTHADVLDIFEEGLARLVQDPLLCDLPIQVTLEEINSQIALEYGQAMTVKVLKADGEIMPIVVVQDASVLDLKKAIRRRYIWRSYNLVFQGEKLEDDRLRLKDYGIRNRDEVTFMKRLRKK
ncbi:U11/U12 small nuclear ribonucleoprotein 25 kDa protein isoform X2 [Hippocampus zosterae]|uniref:U11/U12 small nuclear ribonucleoprotein 25 kDa protein isoform X2 n=1 Tax=Hippocampus zosterae TaxID=109293 RepID=UPI00223CF9B6|nr:U11/U12 small nuclear ribonucleoprotein 25 kDa protein isoform X2 [Hippocampus zosterae]